MVHLSPCYACVQVGLFLNSLFHIILFIGIYCLCSRLFFFQVFKAMLSASSGFSNLDISLCYPREFFSKVMTLAKKYNDLDLAKSKATDENMFIKNTEILVDAALESESVDIILNDSRNKHLSSMNSDEASSSAMDNVSMRSTCKEITISYVKKQTNYPSTPPLFDHLFRSMLIA